MCNSNKLIVLINSDAVGVVDESKAIRTNKLWRRKTLFFFKYLDYAELIDFARNKKFPTEFKFPIPYKTDEELTALVLFGIHHVYLYTLKRGKKNGG